MSSWSLSKIICKQFTTQTPRVFSPNVCQFLKLVIISWYMLCRRNYRGVLFVMKMQLSCALIVIMISTAKAAFPKVMMNGNSSITGMCLTNQKSEIVVWKLYYLYGHLLCIPHVYYYICVRQWYSKIKFWLVIELLAGGEGRGHIFCKCIHHSILLDCIAFRYLWYTWKYCC